MIPKYGQIKNNPFMTNEHKERVTGDIQDKKKKESSKSKESSKTNKVHSEGGSPLVDLQIYSPEPSKPKKKPFNLQHHNIYAPVMANRAGFEFMKDLNKPTIINEYNIHSVGPMDNHQTLASIFEDKLPYGEIANIDTIEGRMSLISYIRSQLLQREDGEDIGLGGGKERSLQSYLKFLNINPYSDLHYSKNPYRDLPDGFLLYNSCYPIRSNENRTDTICAKDSIGMNVRIYKITKREFNLKNSSRSEIFKQSDVWREIAYYEYIRDRIVKKGICPNFITMYCYYLSEKSGVDFVKLNEVRNKRVEQDSTHRYKKIEQEKTYSVGITNQTIGNINQNEDIYEENQDIHSGEVLVALTEAPTRTLKNWASKIYSYNGSIKIQVNSGFYNKRTWNSVLFQLMASIYVLQNEGIHFVTLSIDNNVFIRELKTKGNVTNYWKYIINGIEYYIPNYGFMVLIDSKFKEPPRPSLIGTERENKRLYAPFFNDESNDDNKRDIFDNFRQIFTPEQFKGQFVNQGGTPPPHETMNLLDKIHTSATARDADTNIDTYLEKFMTSFMNNRIGTLLKENEVKLIREEEDKEFTRGDIVVQSLDSGQYSFVLFLKLEDDGNACILTKQTPTSDIARTRTPLRDLIKYSKFDTIEQEFKANEDGIIEDNIIDTYVIS